MDMNKDMGVGEAVVWLGIFRHAGTMWELYESAGEIVVRSDDGREMTPAEAIGVAKGIVHDRAKALAEKPKLKRDVLARPECIFCYCPTPHICRDACAAPSKAAEPEPDYSDRYYDTYPPEPRSG